MTSLKRTTVVRPFQVTYGGGWGASGADYSVVLADESDSTFLQLSEQMSNIQQRMKFGPMPQDFDWATVISATYTVKYTMTGSPTFQITLVEETGGTPDTIGGGVLQPSPHTYALTAGQINSIFGWDDLSLRFNGTTGVGQDIKILRADFTVVWTNANDQTTQVTFPVETNVGAVPALKAPTVGAIGSFVRPWTQGHVDVPAPAGVEKNSVVLVHVHLQTNYVITPPADWTPIGYSEVDFGGAAVKYRIWAFWHRATGPEAGPYVFTWPLGSIGELGAYAARLDGCATSGDPIDGVTSGNVLTSTYPGPPLSLNIEGNQEMLVYLTGDYQEYDWNPPAGWTGQTVDNGMSIFTKVATLGGPTGTVQATCQGNSPGHAGMLFAVRGKPVDGTPTVGAIAVPLNGFAPSLPVPVPAGVVSGSVVVLPVFVEWGATVTPPAGWAVKALVQNEDEDGPHWFYLFWHRASGVETGTYAFTQVGTNGCVGYAIRLDGCPATGDPFDGAVTGMVDTGRPSPALSTTLAEAGELLLHFTADFQQNLWDPPTGWTERYDYLGVQFATKAATGAGAVGPIQSQSTNVINDHNPKSGILVGVRGIPLSSPALPRTEMVAEIDPGPVLTAEKATEGVVDADVLTAETTGLFDDFTVTGF